MKKLASCVSTSGWVLLFLTTIFSMLILLRPTWVELLVMLTVDSIAFLIIQRFEYSVFEGLYPETKPFFRGLDLDVIQKMKLEEKTRMLEVMMAYPAHRALFCALGSFVKTSLGILLVVFYWKHEISNWSQFGIVMGIGTVNFVYFYGLIFFDSHSFLSEEIKKLHALYDWSDVFRNINLSIFKFDFEAKEILIFCSMGTLMLVLQSVVIHSNGTKSVTELIFAVSFVAIACLVLIFHMWLKSRKFFVGGLKDLFTAMDALDQASAQFVLPLHTSELIARFEQSFNILMEKLRASQNEVTQWVVKEAEQNRYRILGEVSALVAHDMIGPLHAMNFCVKQVIEDPELLRTPRYQKYLNSNLIRALELVENLRSRLKNPETEIDHCMFWDAHSRVVPLLAMQFYNDESPHVRFRVEPKVEKLRLKISRVDLIHVIDNLYRNSFEVFRRFRTENPEIRISCKPGNEIGTVGIYIQDNGNRLDSQMYEEMTSFHLVGTSRLGSTGLGLKLVRRLVENNGGTLTVLDESEGTGTTFLMTLYTSPHQEDSEMTQSEEEIS